MEGMDKTEKGIAACSSCHTTYKVPVVCEGETVSCKRCGNIFSLVFQDEMPTQEAPQNPSLAQKETEEISHDDSFLLIGSLALKHKFASKEQIKEAMKILEQGKEADKGRRFGEIMVSHGMISQAQLDFLLSVQRMMETIQLDQKFGMIAVKNDFANQKDVLQALQEQKRLFKENITITLMGDILVKSGTITEQQRDAILKKQKRLQQGHP